MGFNSGFKGLTASGFTWNVVVATLLVVVWPPTRPRPTTLLPPTVPTQNYSTMTAADSDTREYNQKLQSQFRCS